MAGIGTISVELNNLKGISARMQTIVDSLSGARQALENVSGDMDAIWEGKAKNKFSENSREVTGRAKELAEEIQQRKNKLDESIAAYDKVEMKVQTDVQDLSTNDIF